MNIFKLFSPILIVSFICTSCSNKVNTNDSISGRSIEWIINYLGRPNYQKEFILSENPYEYQYGLLTYFPKPEGKNIRIKEFGWKTKFNEKVVWFHKKNGNWVSIDNISWNPNRITF